MRITRITIVKEAPKTSSNINELLLLLGSNLGLFSMRDKDKSCYRIFIILVKALKVKVELTSDELAAQTGLSRGTVIHHLNHLMDAGIVTNYKNKYFINYDSLEDMVEDMRKGVSNMFDNIGKVARKIDSTLELK